MPCFVNIIRKMELPQPLLLSASHRIKCFCNFIRILSLLFPLSCEIGTANRNITFPFTVVVESINFWAKAKANGLSLLRQEDSRKELAQHIHTLSWVFVLQQYYFFFHIGPNSAKNGCLTPVRFLCWISLREVKGERIPFQTWVIKGSVLSEWG